MAEEGTVVALMCGATKTAKDCIKTKEMIVGVDLPQDYSFPPHDGAAVTTVTSSNISSAKTVVAAAHAWVSPNKSDEGPSSEESSPTCDDSKTNETVLDEPGINANLDQYDGGKEEASDPDLSIIGQRIEVQHLDVASITDTVLDTAGNDCVRILYGVKEVMMILPSEVNSFSSVSYMISTLLLFSLPSRSFLRDTSWDPPSILPRLWPPPLVSRIKLSVSRPHPLRSIANNRFSSTMENASFHFLLLSQASYHK